MDVILSGRALHAAKMREWWANNHAQHRAKIAAALTPAVIAKRAASLRRPLAERFARHFSVNSATGCWDWHGAKDTRGYGQMRIERKTTTATHIALLLDGRPRPVGKCALHSCDNPGCVNPAHLRWGTLRENTADALLRGRLDLSGLDLGRRPKAELKTHCLRGHDFAVHGRSYASGTKRSRTCLACAAMLKRERRARSKANA